MKTIKRIYLTWLIRNISSSISHYRGLEAEDVLNYLYAEFLKTLPKLVEQPPVEEEV